MQLDFGEQFELISDAIRAHVCGAQAGSEVLEVGCGPAFLSLELARSGFRVTGVNLSEKCVEIAKHFAAKAPFSSERGSLCYLAGDFFSDPALESGSFDAVVFLGALHHFPDQSGTLERVERLLKPGGLVIAHEPARDRVTKGNAVFVHSFRVLLSARGGFFEHQGIPANAQVCTRKFDQLFSEMRYETEDGANIQPVNANEAGYAEMYPPLSSRFDQLVFAWRYAFFHEFIGGVRFSEELNVAPARYLREVDRELCREGVLNAAATT